MASLHPAWSNGDITLLILGFLSARELVRATSTCNALAPLGSDDGLWCELCAEHGFKQRSATRTRGKLPWRVVYARNLCAECRMPGSVVLNLAGGKTSALAELVPLCERCYGRVHAATSLTERLALLAHVHPEARRIALASTVSASKKRKGGARAGV